MNRFFAILAFSVLTFSASAMALESARVDDSAAFSLRIDAAQSKEDAAQAFISQVAKTGIGFLRDEKMSQEQRKAEFRKLLRGSFDMKTIGRFSLGRYWKEASKAQQEEYLKLFEASVVETYAKRFEEYQGQELEVRSAKPEGDRDVLVSSFIVPNDGPEVKVDWRVRDKGGQYKVVDVMVEGVSMALTQRSDFASVIQRGGGDVQVLIDNLRQK